MANRDGGRVLITPLPAGLHIEIRPLIRRGSDRGRLLAAAGVLVGAGLFGGIRLAGAWETGLRKGDFPDLPLPVLALLTAAVGLGAPLAFIGLAALAFAEETVDVRPDEIVIETAPSNGRPSGAANRSSAISRAAAATIRDCPGRSDKICR